jgi:hypothetical protein
LGQPIFEIPEPPLLIDNLRFHGYVFETQGQIDEVCANFGWSEKELFSPVDDFSWEDQWEHTFSPEAQAFAFLQNYDLFPLGFQGMREGQIVFEDARTR